MSASWSSALYFPPPPPPELPTLSLHDALPISTQRNIGVAIGHSLLAVDNVRRGLAGLDVDTAALERDLDASWEVLGRSEEHTSELQSRGHLVCRLLLEKKNVLKIPIDLVSHII